MCRALVGLADVEVVGVIGWTVPLQVHIASTLARPVCAGCVGPARVKQTMRRRLVDLPVFGRPTVLVWRQVRWCCPAMGCPVRSWTQTDGRIVVGNRGMTDRAARWACEQVGRHGRSVAEVAADLGCDWHSVNRPVVDYGLALIDDPGRIGPVTTLGLDETAFVRVGPWRHRLWSTQLVGDNQLLDVVLGFPRMNGHREIRRHGSGYGPVPRRVGRACSGPSGVVSLGVADAERVSSTS